MPESDWPIEQLRAYRPELAEPADLDEFWSRTLSESRALTSAPVIAAVETPVSELVVEDLTFSGYAGEPVRGWVVRPRSEVQLPAVIEFVGYGGGRGLPHERLHWASAGYVHVIMDTRGQGSHWGGGGATPDPHGSGPASDGVMTRGIESPDTYYYRRLFTDAALLVDVVRGLPAVDATRVAITGGSQGGAITLAVAALVPDVAAVMPDVPFLADFRRSVSMTPKAPFTQVRDYLAIHRDRVDDVFATLSYFDAAILARRATAPARFSVALMDEVVLPSSVFAAFNNYGGPHEIDVYEFNGHEGGQGHQWLRQARWLRGLLAD
jgi:cephalosporin-C deacetylase